MRYIRYIFAPAITLGLVLLSQPLSAQRTQKVQRSSAPTGMAWGIHGGLTFPQGDMKDTVGAGTDRFFGFHLGGHLDFSIQPLHDIRAHLSYHSLPGSGWGGGANLSNDYTVLQLGGDWIYRAQGRNQGWHFLAGASLNNLKRERTANTAALTTSFSQSGKLGMRVGGGYTINPNFSVDGHLNQVSVERVGGNGFGFGTATWAQISVVYKF